MGFHYKNPLLLLKKRVTLKGENLVCLYKSMPLATVKHNFQKDSHILGFSALLSIYGPP